MVLLDEPTAGLDPVNARNIRQQISAISDQTTFLISSHNLQELEHLCQTILLLEKGHLIQQAADRNNNSEKYITLRMAHVNEAELISIIQDMPGINSITQHQKNEFVIRYDHSRIPSLDQKLLKLLAERNWQYRHLINGQTLEEQLFST